MPKTYSAGDQLLASEYNQIVKVAGCYAATSTGNDTYAITVSPAPTAYAAGDEFSVKIDVANTGPATLNVNSLGAVDLKKNVSEALETGDLIANEIIRVKYDGTNFQVRLPRVKYATGTTTYDMSTASGNQTIAHGLGKIPKKVLLCVKGAGGTNASFNSIGVYDGTNMSNVFDVQTGTPASGSSQSTAYIARASFSSSFADRQDATITVDATDITLAWTKTGSPSGTANILFSVEA